jgi:hypothetical protein
VRREAVLRVCVCVCVCVSVWTVSSLRSGPDASCCWFPSGPSELILFLT